MENKVTVFEFVTEFGHFYNNVLVLIEEGQNNQSLSKIYTDNVYDKITEYKDEVERTLEARVLSTEKAGNMLQGIVEQFVSIGNNCFENYELVQSNESYEAYKFFNSVIDCYNELCSELGYC
jgi:hypothetical protein